jgi:hypothetical protein
MEQSVESRRIVWKGYNRIINENVSNGEENISHY